MNKPNIIYLVADQLRYDMLGKGFTPNIDSIAQHGVSFQRAYCGCPLCVPSRGSLFTGTYPNTNGSLINPWLALDEQYGSVRAGIDNTYSMLERGGWDCIHSGKQHLYTEGGNLETRPDTKIKWLTTEHTYKDFLESEGVSAPGGAAFRSPVPEMAQGRHTRLCTYSNPHTGCYPHGLEHYFDGYFTDMALQGLRERDTSKPLFLSAMFLAPHPPLDVPDPFYSAFGDNDVKLSENVGKWYKYQSPLQLYNLTGAVGAHYDMGQWRETWRTYMGLVSLLDSCVGRLLDELKVQGIYDDSLIIFTSDHGEMLGSHKLFQKMCMYEESARTPVYIKFPQNRYDGTVIDLPVSQIDLQPTLCDYLNIPPQNPMDGCSLMPALNGEAPNRPVYIQFDGNGARSNFQRCIVEGDYKLIADIFKDEVYYELYNITADPQETQNLIFADKLPELAKTMLGKLVKHMEDTHDLVEPVSTDLEAFVQSYRGLSARGGV